MTNRVKSVWPISAVRVGPSRSMVSDQPQKEVVAYAIVAKTAMATSAAGQRRSWSRFAESRPMGALVIMMPKRNSTMTAPM